VHGEKHGQVVYKQLQIQASASAEQTLPHDRHSYDYYCVAAVFLPVALGAGPVRLRLAASIPRSCDRGKPTGLLPESDLLLHRPVVAGSARGSIPWSSALISFKIVSVVEAGPWPDREGGLRIRASI